MLKKLPHLHGVTYRKITELNLFLNVTSLLTLGRQKKNISILFLIHDCSVFMAATPVGDKHSLVKSLFYIGNV